MKFKFSIILIAAFAVFSSCKKKTVPVVDYAQEMRNFVIGIAEYARVTNSDFYIVPQNGEGLLAKKINPDEGLDFEYAFTISGQAIEDLYYGYDNDDEASPDDAIKFRLSYLELLQDFGKPILSVDYCSTQNNIDDSYEKNGLKDFVSFAAPERNLTVIPSGNINNVNDSSIDFISGMENFLYLLNPTENYTDKTAFINAIDATNYDGFVIDLFFNENNVLSKADLEKIKTKPNGEKRIVLCYMSIGEAEDYRYYWKKEWSKNKTEPAWLYKENKNWKGNFKVFYWMADWQAVIYGSSDAYLDKIINSGFDGVYLDIIDAYEYFDDIIN